MSESDEDSEHNSVTKEVIYPEIMVEEKTDKITGLK